MGLNLVGTEFRYSKLHVYFIAPIIWNNEIKLVKICLSSCKKNAWESFFNIKNQIQNFRVYKILKNLFKKRNLKKLKKHDIYCEKKLDPQCFNGKYGSLNFWNKLD